MAKKKSDEEALKAKSDADKEVRYKDAIAKGDKMLAAKEYKVARFSYNEALSIKPGEKYPKDKIGEIDVSLKSNTATAPSTTATTNPDEEARKKEFKNALSNKYPQGITEETETGTNFTLLKRIVVKDKDAWLYIKKTWGWGGVYYFKDDMPISENTFNTETAKSK